MHTVPFSSDYDQQFTTPLGEDGDKYTFEARWNERGKNWTFDLTRDTDDVKLLAGVPMLIGQDLLQPYALGIGGLIVFDLGQKNTDPGPEDLGSRVLALYLSNQDLRDIKTIIADAGSPQTIVVGGAAAAGLAVPPLVGGNPGGAGAGGSGGGTTIVTNVTNTTNNITIEGGGLGFSDPTVSDDASGDEVLIGRYLQIPGLSVSPTVALNVAVLARGNGTVRAYVGGTAAEQIGDVGTPSGTSVGTPAAVTADGMYQISGSLSNPGGVVLVKITMQSAAPATNIGIDLITGALA